jgi:acetyl esterase
MTAAPAITVEDIPYRSLPSGELLARLYRPAGTGPFPAVVSVHGGRWVSQSRLTNDVIDRALAEAGVVVMALDFRMPPVARYPEPVSDINFAIRWLKRESMHLGSHPAWVGGIGTSSGGHQTMLNALRPDDPRYAAIPLADARDLDASLAYAVACWPVLDPLARYRMAKQKNMEVHIKSHDAYWPDEASMGEGNPQLILERGDQKRMPPILLVQGTGDNIVPAEMTEHFAATYRANGGSATFKTFAGKPHTFITNEPNAPESLAAIDAIKTFVLEQARRIALR